jgi:Uma2 family endonuclease
MSARAELEQRDDRPTEDHVVELRGVTWKDYERLLAMRGDRSAPRFTYIDGVLEIMSPSRSHEKIKSLIGRLVEAYCVDRGIPFLPLGSWTLKQRAKKAGAEPDECYVFDREESERPHLVIEVVWTSGRIDKLEIYGKLGVPEVWHWRKGRIQVHVLRRGRYVAVTGSARLPDLDLDLLCDFLDHPSAYDAIRDFRAALDARG